MQSGFLGLAGNADLRSVVAAADSGDAQAKLAIEVSLRMSIVAAPCWLTH